MFRSFDVVVVGGGHAGVEAAAVAARTGARVALVCFDARQIGAMSCNPAIGGLGKGHLVREVDAFDGLIARAADHAAIHYRMLNLSKGAAVQGPRIQADRRRYKAAVAAMLRALPAITIVEDEAVGIQIGAGNVTGLACASGEVIGTATVVLATGTFLNGRLYRGEAVDEGGRAGERAARPLGAQLAALGLPVARLKTGTPPRLDGRSIDWAALEEQPSDAGEWTMSAMTHGRQAPQISCAITRTNARTHEIIRAALDRSPLYSGAIEGSGPRYCPSIEDKIVRFADRESHQVFLEPEGIDDHLVYPNGISTSLPLDVQEAMIRSMSGLGAARLVEPGYAVEYDYIDPRALDASLMVRATEGLFCAGQINGTTGYEEAAAQGLIAGLNAARHARGRPAVVLDRVSSYIGVMIDDLVLQGVTEPYRMLTARAEYRLRLRADNATTRLTAMAIETGCVGRERADWFAQRERERRAGLDGLDQINSSAALRAAGADVPADAAYCSLAEWLRFATVSDETLRALSPAFASARAAVRAELIEDGRYAPYLARQEAEIRALRADEAISIDHALDYGTIAGLSTEMRERLEAARPATLAAATRIRGITPAALSAILVRVKRKAA